MTIPTSLPGGWKLETPEPGGSRGGVARLSKGGFSVNIRRSHWLEPIEEDSYRAIAGPGRPACEDWILTATSYDRPIPVPGEIRRWAAHEVRYHTRAEEPLAQGSSLPFLRPDQFHAGT